jgi:hypothetical protein
MAATCDLAQIPHTQIVPQINACLTELVDLRATLYRRPQLRIPELLERLRLQVAQMEPHVRFQDVGTVQHIGHGVATISGLPRACTDEWSRSPKQGMVSTWTWDWT